MEDDLYTASALYYDGLMTDRRHYAADAEFIRDLVSSLKPGAKSLLDIACGTGRHLEYLLRWFDVEGGDLSDSMLRVARARLPEVTLHNLDMRAFNLGKTFDVVICMFSAIAYAASKSELRVALKSFARHLRPGGIVLVEPWIQPDDFEAGRITTESFELFPRHQISRMIVSSVEDGVSILDMHYLIGTETGVRHIAEQHRLGLYTEDQYRDAFVSAGFSIDFDPTGPFNRGLVHGKLN
jgi:SAM-dependent methyltransferase